MSDQVLLMESMLSEAVVGRTNCELTMRGTRVAVRMPDNSRDGSLPDSRPVRVTSKLRAQTMPSSKQFIAHIPVHSAVGTTPTGTTPAERMSAEAIASGALSSEPGITCIGLPSPDASSE